MNSHPDLPENILLKKLERSLPDLSISASSPLMFCGSCFSQEVGVRLKKQGWIVQANASGTLFDPQSIARHFLRVIKGDVFKESELFYHDGLWRHWDYYSKLGGETKEAALSNLNQMLASESKFLNHAKFLFITFGTAWYYVNKAEGKPVANCHKMPSQHFSKHILSSNEMLVDWSEVLMALKAHNPGLQICMTVSPVRHLRDGVVENSRSKAVLLNAIHELAEKNIVDYIPVYEYMNDVLKDHSWYKGDFAHPSEEATEKIHEWFCASFISVSDLKSNEI